MQILHTRLRTGFSSLNYDLYSKNIIESPLCNCRCGEIENADHFFFRCHLYQNRRQVIMDTLSQHGNITLNIILNGDLNLPNEANIAIFEAVQTEVYPKNEKILRNLIGHTRISHYLYQTKWTLNSDNDSEHTSMTSLGSLLHRSQSPVTSYLFIVFVKSAPQFFISFPPSVFLHYILCNLFLFTLPILILCLLISSC